MGKLRLLLLCLSLGLLAPSLAHARETLGTAQSFWVLDLQIFPHSYREAPAKLVAEGAHTLIYAEDGVWFPTGYLPRLLVQLEAKPPAGALFPDLGILGGIEKLFGMLPPAVNGNEKLHLLFTSLGRADGLDGYFNPADRLTAAAARASGERSNETNIVYINGYQGSDERTAAAITRAAEELLVSAARPRPGFPPDLWLSQTLSEAALLSVGLFSEQTRLNRYVQSSADFPLVSHSSVQYGPQILFAAYLLDQAGNKGAALSALADLPLKGRAAVESVFRNETGAPLTFDLIYSNFLSYIFRMAEQGVRLPFSVEHAKGRGLVVPDLTPYVELKSIPAIVEGSVYPYAFALFDLPEALPSTAIVQVDPVRQGQRRPDGSFPCSETASVLWKPVSAKRIAVYSVGCEHETELDRLHFRLSILDRPFR